MAGPLSCLKRHRKSFPVVGWLLRNLGVYQAGNH